MSQFASHPTHKTIYSPEAEAVEIPIDTVSDWRYDVANDDTNLGLLEFHRERLAATGSEEGEPSGLRGRLLTILGQLQDRRNPGHVASVVLIRSETKERLSPDQREQLISILEEIMSRTHSNDEIADTILEYLDR